MLPDIDPCALALFRAGAVKFGAFRLKLHETNPDAPLSPFYLDMRVIRSHPEERRIVVDEYEKLIQGIPFDVLADVPTAATPLVAILADRLDASMVTPRTDTKTHGSGAAIDGAFEPGQRALVIDHLITGADSKLEAIRCLEAGGLVVTDVVVLVDRQQGGVKRLQEAGYKVHVKYPISELLRYYMEAELLEKTKGEEVFQYLKL
jgi:uridine monophosphate synthetase